MVAQISEIKVVFKNNIKDIEERRKKLKKYLIVVVDLVPETMSS